MWRKLAFFVLLALLISSFSGCASFRRPAPGPAVPQVTPGNQVQPTVADQIVQMVNKMTGVKASYAVVIGNLAMIGVDLKDRLNADQENQLKDRIAAEVKAKMPQLAEVWVTADPDLVVRIRDLAARIARGEPISGFFDEVNNLIQKLRPQRQG